MASLAEFLRGLLKEGVAVLRAPPPAKRHKRREAVTLLAEAFADYRLDVAGPPILFDADAGLAAAEQLWLGCWFVVHKGEPPAEVEKCLHAV